MARYRATAVATWSQLDAFAYMSDFANTAEWDPGVASAQRTTPDPIGLGSEFSVMVKLPGRTTEFVYRITEFTPPRSLTLLSQGRTITSLDRIDVTATGDGSEITYDAELTLNGWLRYADPLLQFGFNRAAARALAGLRQVTSRPR